MKKGESLTDANEINEKCTYGIIVSYNDEIDTFLGNLISPSSDIIITPQRTNFVNAPEEKGRKKKMHALEFTHTSKTTGKKSESTLLINVAGFKKDKTKEISFDLTLGK